MQRGLWAKCNLSCNPTNRLTFKRGGKSMWFMSLCRKGVGPCVKGKNGFKLSKLLGSKWSVLHIKNEDSPCLICTLVTDIAWQEHYPTGTPYNKGVHSKGSWHKTYTKKQASPKFSVDFQKLAVVDQIPNHRPIC